MLLIILFYPNEGQWLRWSAFGSYRVIDRFFPQLGGVGAPGSGAPLGRVWRSVSTAVPPNPAWERGRG